MYIQWNCQPGIVQSQLEIRAILNSRSPLTRLLLPTALAHLLSWAAFFGVVFWPFGYSATTRTPLPGGVVRYTFSQAPGPFMQYLGPEEVLLLLMPTALTGIAVLVVWIRLARPAWNKLALWVMGILCLLYCSVPVWFIEEVDISFIGVLYLPAALASIGSAIIEGMSRPKKDARSER